jgi:cytochrome P450
VQVILGICFASVHQPALSLVYALDDISTYPRYSELLRQEVEECLANDEDLDSSPLLDSFLKESARLHPSDSISVRRKALQPYKFADGTCLSKGDVACVPLQALMRDESLYPDSLKFDAFRFFDQCGNGKTARFTDSTPAYPLWGLGKRVW